MKRILAACVSLLLSTVHGFDWLHGNLTLYHSESAYCDPDSYMSRTYKPPLDGFIPTYAISDLSYDTHGYIGYQPNNKAITVVYRGSESFQNWLSDLDAVLTRYPLCDNCEVHKGFYGAEQVVVPNVISEVWRLQKKYPEYNVYVTGHSLGAAIATLTAADLSHMGVKNVKLFNYGSPRVGNTAFADFYPSIVDSVSRVTHHKDIVPHVPMHERFTHIAGEYYEADDSLNVVECQGEEDKKCSYQWHITSISDHLYYLGLNMGEGKSECAQLE